ncbi:MAG TPA: hypothetical protein VMW17_00885 [Candidatus Binatia bacterium]|nr:hypothetical protein [Candidatus Binatia bacterium]
MNPSTSSHISGPRQFCGHCDTAQGPGCVSTDASQCAIGCQSDAECGAGQCNFADTIDGFEGDTTVASIESHGSPSIYSPINTGVFCTGITSSTQVNAGAGLPGPVRYLQPAVNMFLTHK